MCALPLASSQPPSSTLLVSPPFHALPSPGPHLAPRTSHCLYAFISAPQRASSFNQPLSLDTPSVTTMYAMFYVRSTRALPHFPVETLHACCLRHRHPTLSPASRLAPRPALDAPLSTRQSASSFNQPLSLDTSSVTTMYVMFAVRSPARCLHGRRRPSRVSAHTSHLAPLVCLPFDSAGRVFVQPAAEPRHV